MKIKIVLMIAVLALFGVIYAACDSGSGTDGDPAELGYNIATGKVGITAAGTVTVTHGMGVTPSVVLITNAITQTSGTGTVYSVVSIGASTFTVLAYDIDGDGNAQAQLGGSISYVAIE